MRAAQYYIVGFAIVVACLIGARSAKGLQQLASGPTPAPPVPEAVQEKAARARQALEAMGLTLAGVWKDPNLLRFGQQVDSIYGQGTPEEAVQRYEALYEEAAADETLRILADDVLLKKARMLFWVGRYGQAQEAFEAIVQRYPAGTMDLAKAQAGCVPTLAMSVPPFLLAGRYVAEHPNRSADAARLGLALCAIALKDYEKAEGILAKLVPAGEKRPPSEDPLVRTPGPDGYLAFYNDSRLGDLLAERSDKIALLWQARAKVLEGKADQARDLYETMLSLFPASGMRAEYELELLNSGKMDELAETVSLHLMNPWLRTTVMRGEKVLEILKLPDQTNRIEAAKAYYAGLHNGLKEEVERLRRKREFRGVPVT